MRYYIRQNKGFVEIHPTDMDRRKKYRKRVIYTVSANGTLHTLRWRTLRDADGNEWKDWTFDPEVIQ